MSLRPGTLSEHLKLDENFDASINSGATDSDGALQTASADDEYRRSDDEFEEDSEVDDQMHGHDLEKSGGKRQVFEVKNKKLAAGEKCTMRLTDVATFC
jgi:hypothetical protein